MFLRPDDGADQVMAQELSPAVLLEQAAALIEHYVFSPDIDCEIATKAHLILMAADLERISARSQPIPWL